MIGNQPHVFDRRVLDGLIVLRAVVESGSLVRAGRMLGLTQSAVSRAVSRLEDRVGARLFRRSARSLSLTDEGRRFYESVTPHLAAIEDATTEVGGATTSVRGRLRVNVDPGIGQHFLTPRLPEFLAKYPELAVELESRDRMGDLVRDGYDVAVRFGPPKPSALKARLLLRTRVITCASPAYLARHGVPRQPRDLEKHQCVLVRDPNTGGPYGWELVSRKKTVEVNVSGQLMLNAGGPVLVACLAGQGVAQVLELYARAALADGRLVQLLPEWAHETWPLYAYHHSAQLMSAKVRAFLEFVTALTKA